MNIPRFADLEPKHVQHYTFINISHVAEKLSVQSMLDHKCWPQNRYYSILKLFDCAGLGSKSIANAKLVMSSDLKP